MWIKRGLLALLESGPMYGYQLRVAFEESTGGTWPLNVGQVCTTLSRLERDGLVRALPAGTPRPGKAVLRLLRAEVDAGAARALMTHEARHAAWADRVVSCATASSSTPPARSTSPTRC
jgi:Transcriptional regulator PadR-like family